MKKMIIGTLVGAAVGALVAHKVTKKQVEATYEKDIDVMISDFDGLIDTYKDIHDGALTKVAGYNEYVVSYLEEKEMKEKVEATEETVEAEVKEVKEDKPVPVVLQYQGRPTDEDTDYNELILGQTYISDPELIIEEQKQREDDRIMEMANMDYQELCEHTPIQFIDAEEFVSPSHELPYDQMLITYHIQDQKFSTDEYEILDSDEVVEMFGVSWENPLAETGHIYIRNHPMSCDYEIICENSKCEDLEVLN